MPNYEIQFTVHNSGANPTSPFGHMNVLFVIDGIAQETVGAQSQGGVAALDPNHGMLDGYMRIETQIYQNGGVYGSVPVTQLQYETLSNYALNLGLMWCLILAAAIH